MDLKEFFKPNWKKAISFVFIILLAMGVLVNFYVSCENRTLCILIDYLRQILFMPFILFPCESLAHQTYCPLGDLTSVIDVPLIIILWYALSCIIVYIYDKLKAKK